MDVGILISTDKIQRSEVHFSYFLPFGPEFSPLQVEGEHAHHIMVVISRE
jgi:hypothetical protein